MISTFSFQMLLAAGFLVLIIWYSNRSKTSAAPTERRVPDLRAHLYVDDHHLLSAIKSVEKLFSDWNALEYDKAVRCEGVDGLILIEKSIEKRRGIKDKTSEEFVALTSKIITDLSRMETWLKSKIELLEPINDKVTPTHQVERTVH